jgi:hypothetical protein
MSVTGLLMTIIQRDSVFDSPTSLVQGVMDQTD